MLATNIKHQKSYIVFTPVFIDCLVQIKNLKHNHTLQVLSADEGTPR
jgi:hypothetical protein